MLLAGCAPATTGTEPEAADTAAPHGFVEGATELAEPALQLASADAGGHLELFDLLSEKSTPLGELGPIDAFSTDGRYVFASSASAGTVTIADTGTWTVDHEDHFHYYRAEPRIVGTVSGRGVGTVHASASVAVVSFAETGTATVLDYAELGRGAITELRTLGPDVIADAAVPLGSVVLAGVASVGNVADTVRAFDESGAVIASAECAALDGTITSNVGVVFGCADGAVLATESADGVTLEHIPYPHAVSDGDRARDFRGRAGRPVVSAPAGEIGVWILDTRARSWSLLANNEPVTQIAAVSDTGNHTVALTESGRIVVLDAESGLPLSQTEPILAASLADPRWAAGIELTVDANRAYVNAPAEKLVYEIDFADGARTARTFAFDNAPAFLAQTGR